MHQFGSTGPVRSAAGAGCAQCEAMLADLLDGTLPEQDRAAFELHRADCPTCDRMLADARRGADMLSVLRHDRPAPRPELFERILLATSAAGSTAMSPSTAAAEMSGTALGSGLSAGAAAGASIDASSGASSLTGQAGVHAGQPMGQHGFAAHHPAPQVAGARPQPMGALLAFDPRAGARPGAGARPDAAGWSGLRALRSPGGIAASLRGLTLTMVQPRLAMTAAMAFFSIALTLNLTGVRLSALKASDLRPAAIQRSFYQANAHVVRYYENLRVVYELESRVRDLQRANDDGGPARGPDGGSANGPAEPLEAAPSQPADGRQAKPSSQPGNQPGNRSATRQGGGTSQRQSSVQPAYRQAAFELAPRVSPGLIDGRTPEPAGASRCAICLQMETNTHACNRGARTMSLSHPPQEGVQL